MASYKNKTPENSLLVYVLRLLLIEALACRQNEDEIGMAWVESLCDELHRKWQKNND